MKPAAIVAQDQIFPASVRPGLQMLGHEVAALIQELFCCLVQVLKDRHADLRFTRIPLGVVFRGRWTGVVSCSLVSRVGVVVNLRSLRS